MLILVNTIILALLSTVSLMDHVSLWNKLIIMVVFIKRMSMSILSIIYIAAASIWVKYLTVNLWKDPEVV